MGDNKLGVSPTISPQMSKALRLELARAIAFACRDGRMAREGGKPETANPYTYKAGRVALTETMLNEQMRRTKLFDAWRAGWLMSERRGRRG